MGEVTEEKARPARRSLAAGIAVLLGRDFISAVLRAVVEAGLGILISFGRLGPWLAGAADHMGIAASLIGRDMTWAGSRVG
jgi:hypothetical protein